MARSGKEAAPRFVAAAAICALAAGCSMVPRKELDDSQRVSETLRSDNARLKDQVVNLREQNREMAERAVDDAKRLALQDRTIAQLENSVHAYQTERARLESAYERLTSNLEGIKTGFDDWPAQAKADRRATAADPRVQSKAVTE